MHGKPARSVVNRESGHITGIFEIKNVLVVAASQRIGHVVEVDGVIRQRNAARFRSRGFGCAERVGFDGVTVNKVAAAPDCGGFSGCDRHGNRRIRGDCERVARAVAVVALIARLVSALGSFARNRAVRDGQLVNRAARRDKVKRAGTRAYGARDVHSGNFVEGARVDYASSEPVIALITHSQLDAVRKEFCTLCVVSRFSAAVAQAPLAREPDSARRNRGDFNFAAVGTCGNHYPVGGAAHLEADVHCARSGDAAGFVFRRRHEHVGALARDDVGVVALVASLHVEEHLCAGALPRNTLHRNARARRRVDHGNACHA